MRRNIFFLSILSSFWLADGEETLSQTTVLAAIAGYLKSQEESRQEYLKSHQEYLKSHQESLQRFLKLQEESLEKFLNSQQEADQNLRRSLGIIGSGHPSSATMVADKEQHGGDQWKRPCKYFANGCCMYGSNCRFSHSPTAAAPMTSMPFLAGRQEPTYSSQTQYRQQTRYARLLNGGDDQQRHHQDQPHRPQPHAPSPRATGNRL